MRGSQLGNIPTPQRAGWTIAGLRGGTPQLPQGCLWQIDGQLFIDPPAPPSSIPSFP